MLKILAGIHKNRVIPTLKNAKYRPSTTKFKEAVFSILSSGQFINSNLFDSSSEILDLFCGSGSLAFEAISRGAGHATLIDINPDYLKAVGDFAKILEEFEKITLVNLNALNLPKATKKFDLVFIDPPYPISIKSSSREPVVCSIIDSLIKNQWLKDGSILVVEVPKIFNHSFSNLEIIKEKIYGNNKLFILRHSELNL